MKEADGADVARTKQSRETSHVFVWGIAVAFSIFVSLGAGVLLLYLITVGLGGMDDMPVDVPEGRGRWFDDAWVFAAVFGPTVVWAAFLVYLRRNRGRRLDSAMGAESSSRQRDEDDATRR